MKKSNKKGFTLAELLIVIAIIAVLIAIAIPTFAGALENAKRQTDHANLRNAYAMMQVANLDGGVFRNVNGENNTTLTNAGKLVFNRDGTLSTMLGNAYQIQASHRSTIEDCNGCVACSGDYNSGYIILTNNWNGTWSISVNSTF